MNIVDLSAIAYSSWGIAKGYRIGFAKQTYRALGPVTGTAAGFGTYHTTGEEIRQFLETSTAISSSLGFIISFATPFVVIRALRNWIQETIKRKFASVNALYGAVAGLVRNGSLSLGGIFAGGISPANEWFRADSVIGQTLFTVLEFIGLS